MSTGPNQKDGTVTTFTGEEGGVEIGCKYWLPGNVFGDCSTLDYQNFEVVGYKQDQEGSPFLEGIMYNSGVVGDERAHAFYDGHTGYDYPVPNGTSVYLAAAGTAYHYDDADGPHDVRVDHPNGFSTYYLHLESRPISHGQNVTTDTVIGTIGSNHLHFTVKKGNQRVDPYGWEGVPGGDPLKVDGQDNVCLWGTYQ
jgi:hypothetical protein